MDNRLSNDDKKQIAKSMFLSGKYQQKEISQIVKVSEQTVCRWVEKHNWKELRASLTATRENILAQYHMQLEEINNNIQNREAGKRFAEGKEADTIIKISAAIKKLETETGVAETISVCTKVCDFVRQYDSVKAQEISDIFNAFIETKMKQNGK